MKAKIIHILCEGPTEQGFVNEVLRPYLIDNGVTNVKSVIISTNKKLNAQGGMSSYTHARTDLNIMRQLNPDSSFESNVFTTIYDISGRKIANLQRLVAYFCQILHQSQQKFVILHRRTHK